MGCTRNELLSRISSKELQEWKAYYNLEPFGGEADDYRAAIGASTFANVYRKKGSKALGPSDFTPDWGKKYRIPKKQHYLAIKDMLMSLVKKGKK